MYEFCYDNVKLKCEENAKILSHGYRQFCSLMKGWWRDDETPFDTSRYDLERPLAKGKNEKVISLMKYELSGKTLKKFAPLRAKTYICLIDNGRVIASGFLNKQVLRDNSWIDV